MLDVVKTFILGLALAFCQHAAPVPPGTPRHGIVFTIGGLGSTGPVEIWFRADIDARVLMSYEGPFGVDENAKAKRHALNAADATALWEHAKAVLHAGGTPETSHVSDYTQRLVINDDGDVMNVTGDGPFLDARAKALNEELARLAN